MENLPRDAFVIMLFFSPILVLLIVLSTSLNASAAPHESPNSARALDRQVAATLDSLSLGDINQARVLARQLARQFPRFSLGQLLSAELESAAAFQTVHAAGTSPMSQSLINLLLEAQARKRTLTGPRDDQLVPEGVIQIGKHISDLLLIDLGRSTLFNLSVGEQERAPYITDSHYISSGKAGYGKQREGDNKTPLGIYRITSHRSDASLPDLYGSGALTLNYPNNLDRYLGRTGSGIWLHGVPHSQRSRPPRSSEGCVTMSNEHLTALTHRVKPDETVVMLSHDVVWVSTEHISAQRKALRQLFRQYQDAWASANQTTIQALYESPIDGSASTTTHKVDRESVAGIDASDISIFINPVIRSTTDPVRQNTSERTLRDHQPSAHHVVMNMRTSVENETQLTLYWVKNKHQQWKVVAEQWDGLDS